MTGKRLLIPFFSILFFAAAILSQVPVGTPPPLVVHDDEVIKINSRLIMIPVSVTDGNGQPVKGLFAGNFIINEENRRQEIADVSAAENVPLEIALLFDISGSTDPMFKFEQETAAAFLREIMRPQDRATIFTIGETPTLVQNRNISYVSVETIQSLKPTRNQTAFFDTVFSAADYLETNAPPKTRKVIITISDGEDNASDGIRKGYSAAYFAVSKELNTLTTARHAQLLSDKRTEVRVTEQNRTLKKLHDADTVFYSINPAGSSYKLNKISQGGQSNMERFANETGGTAFLPSFLPVDLKSEFQTSANKAENVRMLETIFRNLANELQAQYLVQYYSDGEFEMGKQVNVDVKVNLILPQGVKIHARQGYFVK